MGPLDARTTRIALAAAALSLVVVVVGVGLAADGGGDGRKEVVEQVRKDVKEAEKRAKQARKGKPVPPEYPPIERAPVAEAEQRPNIVFVYTDDQNYSDFTRRYMPKTMRLLGDGGTLFTNFVVSTPICCPSRAAAFTGSYPHNNGVFFNHGGYGNLRDEQNNIAAWMQHAGYHTAWFGKFLQGYKQAVGDRSAAAPGFDDWLVTLRPKYYRWKLFTNGKRRKITGGTGERAYYTDKLTRKAVKLVHEQAERPRPLFMLLNHLAPHLGEGGSGRCRNIVPPAPRDRGRFADQPLPRPPSFNRIDERGQTAFPSPGRLDRETIAEERNRHRCRLASLAAVDRSIALLHKAFEREGELENTIFVFTSDNGLVVGQHGLKGKDIPYEEGIRMPLAIRVPDQLLDGPRAPTADALAANVDLAPTLLDLADAEPCVREDSCRILDGRSLVPLLEGRTEEWPRDRAILIEGGRDRQDCGFRGLRLKDSVLLETVKPAKQGGCKIKGEPEYYDLAADPYQLENLVVYGDGRDRTRVEELQRRLERLERCAGIEGRDPRPKSGQFCD